MNGLGKSLARKLLIANKRNFATMSPSRNICPFFSLLSIWTSKNFLLLLSPSFSFKFKMKYFQANMEKKNKSLTENTLKLRENVKFLGTAFTMLTKQMSDVFLSSDDAKRLLMFIFSEEFTFSLSPEGIFIVPAECSSIHRCRVESQSGLPNELCVSDICLLNQLDLRNSW